MNKSKKSTLPPHEKDILCQRIETALNTDDLNTLETISARGLFNFRKGNNEDGLNALMYACARSNYNTIRFLMDKILDCYGPYLSKEDEDQENEISERLDEFIYFQIGDGEKEYNAATFAEIRGDKETKKYLYQFFGLKPGTIDTIADLNKENLSEYLNDVSDESIPNFIRAGLYSYQYGCNYRAPRSESSYIGEQERRILKYIGTMIYFHSPKKLGDARLQEVQCMHLIVDNVSFLFIGGNESRLTSKFKETFPDLDKFKSCLSSIPDPSYFHNDAEGQLRATRYANYFHNLTSRNIQLFDTTVMNETDKDIEYLQSATNLITQNSTPLLFIEMKYDKRNKMRHVLDKSQARNQFNTIISNNPTGAIIFLDTSQIANKLRMRHAEEFLVDFAEIANEYAKEQSKTIHITIGGKKRPCLTCLMRIKGSNVVHSYSSNPGLLWKGRLEEQSESNPDAAKECLQYISSEPVYVTTNMNGNETPGYDSGTDDEEETKEDSLLFS